MMTTVAYAVRVPSIHQPRIFRRPSLDFISTFGETIYVHAGDPLRLLYLPLYVAEGRPELRNSRGSRTMSACCPGPGPGPAPAPVHQASHASQD